LEIDKLFKCSFTENYQQKQMLIYNKILNGLLNFVTEKRQNVRSATNKSQSLQLCERNFLFEDRFKNLPFKARIPARQNLMESLNPFVMLVLKKRKAIYCLAIA